MRTRRYQKQRFYFPLLVTQFLQFLRCIQKFLIHILKIISEKNVKYGDLSLLSCLKKKWPQIVPEEAQIKYQEKNTERVVRLLNKFPWELMESPSQEMFKRHLDVAPGDMVLG